MTKKDLELRRLALIISGLGHSSAKADFERMRLFKKMEALEKR